MPARLISLSTEPWLTAIPWPSRNSAWTLRSRRWGTPIDAVLASRCVDRLRADLQVMRDIGNAAARLDQVEHLAPKLRQVTPRFPLLPPDVRHQKPGI